MPYNTNAIPPKRKREDWDGTSYLPLARVRKIIKLDDDIDACTPAAAFLISIAAEEFIWHISEQAHKMTKVEKKPRKNIQYKDLANAVARIDNLEFLADVIPRTVPFGKAILKQTGVIVGGKKNGAGGGTSKGGASVKDAIANSREGEEDGSDGGSPSSETTRLKDLHLSQPSGSGTKKGRKPSRDHDGDLTMQ
ncbi:uncharacterized protein DFL_003301 [Arthrobotrys flagrans]|uniref:Transcription factor CBF/NF-Y/archaeal histone domain-containing protein n=1 Tax=Arthrobotrys flagrans TaxID=97331 RepID=A0A437A1F1_ARTFL|nr:hypothetical protein DFL_003301 [Arthrobotrys flagrans]